MDGNFRENFAKVSRNFRTTIVSRKFRESPLGEARSGIYTQGPEGAARRGRGFTRGARSGIYIHRPRGEVGDAVCTMVPNIPAAK